MNDLNRIRDALLYIPVGGHDVRFRVAAMLKSELGEDGRSLWDEWRGDRGKDEAKSVWKSIKSTGSLTIATLFYEAKKNGWDCHGSLPYDFGQRPHRPDQGMIDDEEIARERKWAASQANLILARATVAKPDHPYLQLKQVLPPESLKEILATDVAKINGYHPSVNGENLAGRLLVVPVVQNGVISTLEFIDGQKRKASLKGRGTRVGGYWASSSLPEVDEVGVVILIGEGVATMLSACASTGYTGVAALSCSNLPKVASIMRERYPSAELVILADLEKKNGKANIRAIEAARLVKGRIAVPSFREDRTELQTDFNDMFIEFGKELVADAINRVLDSTISTHHDSRILTETEWPEPEPLIPRSDSRQYPIDALPDVIKDAVEEVAEFVKAPLPLVASSAIAALSVAAQGLANVKRAENLHGPIGVFLLSIADSGERKTTCDTFFSKPIDDYQNAQRHAAEKLIKEYDAAITAWKSRQDGIKDEIRRHARKGQSTSDLDKNLYALEYEKPTEPKVPRLLYADATPEALAHGLALKWPSGGVVSSEAGVVFGSHGMSHESIMRNLALLNQLWDGSNIKIDRRSSESFTVQGARLTMALQVQEAALRDFLTRSGDLARGTGFLARFLIAWPESTQGRRYFTEAPSEWPRLEQYRQRLSSILNQEITINDAGILTPPMLSLTSEARREWVKYHDRVEMELSNTGKFSEIRDFASKSADNAVRIAALFHVFCGRDGDIAEDNFSGAMRIAEWHLNEALRFFGENALSDELNDALKLEKWLLEECCKSTDRNGVRKNHALQCGPVRIKIRLDAAIKKLVDLRRLRLVEDQRAAIIQLNPAVIRKKCNQVRSP